VRIEALMRDVSDRKMLEEQSRDLYHNCCKREDGRLGTTSRVSHTS